MSATSVSGMKAIDLIIRARLILVSKSPFFGTLAMKLRLIENKSIPTQGVTKNFELLYNPAWIDTKSVDDAVFDLAHELMHLVQRVHDRFPKGCVQSIANLAADYVVDTALTDAGKLKRSWRSLEMVTPDAISLVHDLKLTERVYKHLLTESSQGCEACKQELEGLPTPGQGDGQGQGDQDQGNDQGEGNKGKDIGKWSKGNHTCGHGTCGHGTIEDSLEPMTGADLARVQQQIAYAVQVSKSRGEHLGKVLDDYVNVILNPTVDWRVYLRNCISNTFRGRYSYARQHRRTLDTALTFPSRTSEPGGIVAVLDCSGSMSSYLPKMMGELWGLCIQSGCEKLYVIQHDVAVFNAGLYSEKEIINLKPTLGGTSHIEAFQVIEGKSDKYSIPFKPQLVVCFTDLESNFPESCSVRTIWLSSVEHDVPFGKYLKLEMGD